MAGDPRRALGNTMTLILFSIWAAQTVLIVDTWCHAATIRPGHEKAAVEVELSSKDFEGVMVAAWFSAKPWMSIRNVKPREGPFELECPVAQGGVILL